MNVMLRIGKTAEDDGLPVVDEQRDTTTNQSQSPSDLPEARMRCRDCDARWIAFGSKVADPACPFCGHDEAEVRE